MAKISSGQSGKTAGWYIDQHIRLRQKRKKAEDVVRGIKDEMREIEEEAKRKFSSETIAGARGKLGIGFVQETDTYSVEDRRKLDRFVLRNKALDMFQNRVSKEAVVEYLKAHRRATPDSMGLSKFTKKDFRTRGKGERGDE
jgi:hypothetical protein